MLTLEILLVIGLVLLNGVLAMSELAIVSSRPGRLKAMRDRGVAGARTALALAENPGRFLSTVQVGITLVGILAGAFSGASLGDRLSAYLERMGLAADYAEPVGFLVVVAAITYVSLVIGELVPKQVALKNPEGIACRMAYPMLMLSKVASPFVWLLDGSGRLLIGLLGLKESSEAVVTDEVPLLPQAEATALSATNDRRKERAAKGQCVDTCLVFICIERERVGVSFPFLSFPFLCRCVPSRVVSSSFYFSIIYTLFS